MSYYWTKIINSYLPICLSTIMIFVQIRRNQKALEDITVNFIITEQSVISQENQERLKSG